MRQSPVFLLIAVLVFGSAVPSWAQEQDVSARKQAAAHFTRGVEFFEEGAFRAALIEFERAYGIQPDYRLLYNIGHTNLELQDWLRATQRYEQYLAEGGADVDAERRREVEGILRSLSGRLGRLSIHLNVQDAEVFVDEQRVGVAPLPTTVLVNVGRHRVFARTAGGAGAEKLVDVAGGDLVQVELGIEFVPTLARTRAGAGAARDTSLSRMQRGAIASWALVVPFAAGAVTTGLFATYKVDDLDSALETKPATQASKRRVSDLRDSAKALALTSDIMTGLSAALAVTGVVLWWRGSKRQDGERSSAAALSWSAGPSSVHLHGSF